MCVPGDSMRDLLIPQFEVTIRPLKGHLTIPKRSRIESPGVCVCVYPKKVVEGASPLLTSPMSWSLGPLWLFQCVCVCLPVKFTDVVQLLRITHTKKTMTFFFP